MSGWLQDVDGYAMLSAVEFGSHLQQARECFDSAMRAENGTSAGYALRSAARHLRKAAETVRTIEYCAERRQRERVKAGQEQ